MGAVVCDDEGESVGFERLEGFWEDEAEAGVFSAKWCEKLLKSEEGACGDWSNPLDQSSHAEKVACEDWSNGLDQSLYPIKISEVPWCYPTYYAVFALKKTSENWSYNRV